MNLKKIEEKVMHVLSVCEDARNSDAVLQEIYIKNYHKELIVCIGENWAYRKDLFDEISLGSIRRARRKIQRKEYDELKKTSFAGPIDYTKTIYMPTNMEVLRKRRMLQEKFKDYYR